MTEYEYIEGRLRDEMVVGQMHQVLRDVGRIAGGHLAAGRIQQGELDMLTRLARDLSKNHAQGEREWLKAVEFGRRQPLRQQTIVQAKTDRAIGWDEAINPDDYRIVDMKWLEKDVIEEPSSWNPCAELAEYINLLFDPEDIVAYCTDPFERDGKWIPSKGVYTKTASQILKSLKKGNMEEAVGTLSNDKSGAWIRINPFDGEGVKDVNVTDFRYALIESDSKPVDEQVAIYKKLELPCACIVSSGGKSAHAIVRISASSLEEYHKRVDFLFEVCAHNGLPVDTQNRNPSRYSRMPGIMRDGKKQFIIERSCGKQSWDEWENWIKDLNDDLPDFEPFTMDEFTNPPPKSEELIEGILRVKNKMCIVGPSKAGKSFLLLELAIAVAEGLPWMGFKCKMGKVLYVNLELEAASCTHRIIDVYGALGVRPDHLSSIVRWNLRGRTMTLDKLAPKLIRRAKDERFDMVIIDPIYKVLTGDENSASEMAAFTNLFDRISRDCGCAVVFCHHHSKGAQGDKRSMDRASGSGVFARDPDALIDLLQVESAPAQKVMSNKIECREMARVASALSNDWTKRVGEDDKLVANKLIHALGFCLSADDMSSVRQARADAIKACESMTFWKTEFTLREFASPKPRNLMFMYPTHLVDDDGLLDDAEPDSSSKPAPYERKKEAKPKIDKTVAFKQIIEFEPNADWTPAMIAERLDVSERTALRYASENGYRVLKGKFVKIKEDESVGY